MYLLGHDTIEGFTGVAVFASLEDAEASRDLDNDTVLTYEVREKPLATRTRYWSRVLDSGEPSWAEAFIVNELHEAFDADVVGENSLVWEPGGRGFAGSVHAPTENEAYAAIHDVVRETRE